MAGVKGARLHAIQFLPSSRRRSLALLYTKVLRILILNGSIEMEHRLLHLRRLEESRSHGSVAGEVEATGIKEETVSTRPTIAELAIG